MFIKLEIKIASSEGI